MANAVANMLGKRILLINYPSVNSRDSEAIIKYIFREAKLTDSVLFSLFPYINFLLIYDIKIIFFDECENLFQSRDSGRADSEVNLFLTELEMHNNLVIMATNR
jgi:SpoVK/Ycf46/Vps4 family AAA+-type ATPase